MKPALSPSLPTTSTVEISAATTRVHDFVAQGYNSHSGIIARKNRIAFDALAEHWRGHRAPLKVLDLGVGDGALLAQLQTLPLNWEMTGLDISPAMLDCAAARVPMKRVLAPVEQAAAHLPASHFDLVLGHYVLAYVALPTLLDQAKQLLAPGGVFSLATSTLTGAKPLFLQLEQFRQDSRLPWRRWMARAIERALDSTSIPPTYAELEQQIEAAGLRVQQRQTLSEPLVFNSAEDAFDFFIRQGWGASLLAGFGRLPLACSRALVYLGLCDYTYPICWTHHTEVLQIVRADASC
ncbi:class I SAM-dependent methyltransferase [Paucibacter sp. APW11]|uniref:Class I SAM-dependent methyltransferase n=1 Tax=Roseateles aquae TaxID=3077235 RepID=A0ABU3P7S9_9BURK|nr:class I SAM-dependent methyltransferase [Paucibacter sp. APW11]MDT8998615.1 class I SAM-dependent methyltransferase [Paucibacter sp. APW11]